MRLKEHLTEEGFKKILSIRAVLNKGLSDNLSAAFPEISTTFYEKSTGLSYKIPDPY